MTDYCAVGDVKATGRLDITTSQYDATLAGIIGAASRWLDRYCRLPDNAFAQTATATRYYGSKAVRGASLHLDAPIVTVSSVVNGDGTALTASQYRLEPRNATHYASIYLLSAVAWTFSVDGEIAVAGKWGMALSVPEPIREATAMLAAWTFRRYLAGLQDATANADLGQLVYSEGVPKQVKLLIDPYRWTVI
jgi:hypothetical protein